MQSVTGNKTVVKLLAAGGTNGQPSCVAKPSTKYLGYYHNQAPFLVRSEKILWIRKYRWSSGACRGTFFIIHSLFQDRV
jgi:hypothetical protein